MEDTDAYLKYPKQRKWMNKLWLAEKFGYMQKYLVRQLKHSKRQFPGQI